MPTWNPLWFVAYLLGYTLIVALFAPRPSAVDDVAAAPGRAATMALLIGPWLYLWVLPMTLFPVFGSNHAMVRDVYNHALYFAMFVFGFALVGGPGLWLMSVGCAPCSVFVLSRREANPRCDQDPDLPFALADFSGMKPARSARDRAGPHLCHDMAHGRWMTGAGRRAYRAGGDDRCCARPHGFDRAQVHVAQANLPCCARAPPRSAVGPIEDLP